MYKDELAQAVATGHAAAEKCANKAGDDFKEAALEAVRLHAQRGKPFTTEEVRASFSPESGLFPNDARAWGAVVLKAARLGYIESCGAVPVVSSRGGYKTLWQAAHLPGCDGRKRSSRSSALQAAYRETRHGR